MYPDLKKKISFSTDVENYIIINCKKKYLDTLNLVDNHKFIN